MADRLALIVAMVRKDLLRRIRSPLGLLIVLAFPLLFAGMLAITFGGTDEHPKVRLLVWDRDDSLLSQFLTGAIKSDEVAEHFEIEQVSPPEDSGREMVDELVRSSGVAAMLTIPEGFGAALLAGDPLVLELVRNPAQSIMPEIATQLAQVLTEGLDSASRALREPLEQTNEMLAVEGAPSEESVMATSLGFHRAIQSASELVMPPVMTLQTETVSPESDGEEKQSSGSQSIAGVFLFVLPGVAVYALFMVGDLGMRDLLTEISAGTLRRQLAGPVGSLTLILGKAFSTAVLASASLLVIASIGAFLVEGEVSVSAFLALSAAVVLALTGTGAAVYGASGSEGRGATVSSVVYLLLAFVGGAFVGMDNVPQSLHSVARISPFYWGGEGYREILLAGGGVAEVVPHIAVLSGLGAMTLVLGGWLLNRRLLAGGA